MPSTKITVALSALAYAAQVAAHGFVQGITVDGVYHQGGDPSLHYQNPIPEIAGWLADNQDNGFVPPTSYANADIICHKSATNAPLSIKVAAGSDVELHWNTWPESHHGPVIDYLAPCNGACSTAPKAGLKFTKIAALGLIDASTSQTGTWASDQLIASNKTWTTTIPASVAPGNYVLRHEIIALHSAGELNGAQNYPQCVNLQVTGAGSNALAGGTLGTELYKADNKGIMVSIYPPSGYVMPGPALMSGAGGDDDTPSSSDASSAPVTSATSAPASAASSVAASASSDAVTAPADGNTSATLAPTTLVTKASPSATSVAAPVETGAGDDDYDTCI